MGWLVLGTAVLILGLALISLFIRANPARLAAALRWGGGGLALALAAWFALSGRGLFSAPLAAFGAWLMGLFGQSVRPNPSPGRRSTVRSAALDMELDHDSGVMRGRVLVGRFEGRELAQLSIAELLELRHEIAADPDSVTLLEAYLDRREPLWREHVEDEAAAGSGRPADASPMGDEEAYQVLGLERGASEAEIREAHRRLMRALHPDRGGSTFLAAKINAAKDRLLRKHRTRPGQ